MRCRHCKENLKHTFVDLGFAPPSNAYLSKEQLIEPELYFPLKIRVCDTCWLVQTEDYTSEKALFNSEYAYFSSTSNVWLAHAEKFSEEAINQFQLTSKNFVIEIASNDGYLLKNFVAAGIPCLGIEPTHSTADAAEKLEVPVLREFFSEKLGKQLASEEKQADLIIGNNVYAHVPDINDFTKGLKAALKFGGTVTLEFPHLMRLIENLQFDTIYHEHFSYLSLYTVDKIFTACGLRIWKVEELPTHGGSLRIFGCHLTDPRETQNSVNEIIQMEAKYGLRNLETYLGFQQRVDRIKDDFVRFLLDQKRYGKTVIAFGAAAKGSTLLNYAGIKPDLLPCIFDSAKSKQGKFMPGSHIPVLSPEDISTWHPDSVLILPWNIADEIKSQTIELVNGEPNFVVFIPKLEII